MPARPADVRMGKPVGSDPDTASHDAGRTRGTETSQYPQEEKITMIPQVVASERGRAQTSHVARHGWGCRTATLHRAGEWKPLEKGPIEGDRPLHEAESGIAVS